MQLSKLCFKFKMENPYNDIFGCPIWNVKLIVVWSVKDTKKHKLESLCKNIIPLVRPKTH